MIPYGIVIKQNRIVLQQSLIFWSRKFGLLSPKKFVASSIPFLSVFAVLYCGTTVIFEKGVSPFVLFSGILFNMLLIAFLLYSTALRMVKDYAESMKEEKIQIVLNEDNLEVTTEFSKEVISYSDIELCFEKNFLLTVVTDKHSFPLSISKMHLINGDYDTFASLLKSKVPDRYEKKGDN